jgi:uncharacterized protein YggE
MNKKIILALLIISLAQCSLNEPVQSGWDKESYFTPLPFSVTGVASKKLKPEVVTITPMIETLEKEASASLKKNQDIISQTIKLLK